MTAANPVTETSVPPLRRAFPQRGATERALKLAGMIRHGELVLVLPDGTTHRVVGDRPGPSATVELKRLRAVRRLAFGGSLGWAEAWLNEEWRTPDLRAVMGLAAANEAEWRRLLRGRPLARFVSLLAHVLRPNTRRGARRNIASHYDLGNDFYAAWLDPTLTYSSAEFADPAEPLEAAQQRKVRNLLAALALAPGARILEIGCGWGFLAETAAREFGLRVVAITLSKQQFDYAGARIAAAGLGDRVEVRLQDYREVRGCFDGIVACEMFEGVGERYWPVFFRILRERLRAGGLAALQIITIANSLFDDYRRGADFIQRYVFPGGKLPSPSRLRQEVARAGLVWQGETWFGPSYAATLACWLDRFREAWPTLAASGRYDDRLRRLWEYYLLYCETGFRAGWLDVGRIVLARP